MNVLYTYKTFLSENEALEASDVLKRNGIANRIDIIGDNLVPDIVGDRMLSYAVQVSELDRPKLEKLCEANIGAVGDDHPFNLFEDDELLDVIVNEDEWERNDASIAKFVLEKRGASVSEEKIGYLKLERKEEVLIRKSGDWIYQTFGVSGFIIGFLAFRNGLGIIDHIIYFGSIAIGINYYFLNKKLSNGTKVFIYDSKTRKIGFLIIALNILAFLISMVLKLFYEVW
ncbi:MAG: hypothetical protein JXR03_02435 [Cyclobacteriaceae bacterium]